MVADEVAATKLQAKETAKAQVHNGVTGWRGVIYAIHAALLLALTALFLLGSPHKKDADPAPLKLHVLPSSELPRAPLSQRGSLTADRTQFYALFESYASSPVVGRGGDSSVAAVFVEPHLSPQTPTDLLPNLHRGSPITPKLALSPPLSPSPPPPLSPPPPTPRTAPHEEPWWIKDARLPPRPYPTGSNASLPAADAPGSWAYRVLDPRPGTVLLSTPGPAASRQPYLDDAVILLVKTCGCHPSIFGLILSSPPTNATVGESMCPVARARYHSFVKHAVHVGGPVGPHWSHVHATYARAPFPCASTARLSALYSYRWWCDGSRALGRPLAGSIEPIPGVNVGGCLGDAQDKVDAGKMSPSDLTFFSGYVAWPIARLRDEIALGRWAVARASSQMILDGVRDGSMSAKAVMAAML